ncbi:hypothetical protein ACWT_2603 [Actinoplanes sp. SE50]|uniref:hypothetical protein n=1 Tax=unclassified Actinoplanes TaxID=2626549 RepID=UPI00023ED040|nr:MULTISPECIES: hypothetical protein [unclassified Actinoplanes]AEV83838.1 hypothetical protein ACPL_2943 [Actinoplanes sp. SE50/110]ATO82018.1 hypothetical protein ACWT_2603 [Actinoplanes sp. SE50]SLL99426.1 uncharacterized protein ACSP50_2657 [Actinoplanes sp. SE50/110]
MRKRTIRTLLAAGVLAAGSAAFVNLATGSASAGTGPTTLTGQQRHAIDGYHADRMVVDTVHQRLLIADDVAHRILAVGYDGTVAAQVALPDGANAGDLRLTADAGRLWAILPGAHQIVSWDAATLGDAKPYPVDLLDLGHLTLAGGTPWFTFDKNYFASLDPATGAVTRYVLGKGNDTSASPSQPLIAANPADPTQLALTYAGTRTTLFRYDTAGDMTAPVTAETGVLAAHNTLAYTPDGTMIYVAGAGGVFYTWADDLAGISARTIGLDGAADVATTDGWVAAGTGDVRLYPDAETTAAREFDFPATATVTDLGWGAGAGRLFAISTDPTGAQSLWVIDQPTATPAPATPELTLNRDGSVNAYGATVTMTAHLGTTAQNRTVEIWADPYGTDRPRTLLKKGVVDAAGNLSVGYQLTRNTTFSVVFAGDAGYAARTVTSAVNTSVAVATTVANHYTVKRSYYYVHKSKNPVFGTTMTPYPGRTERLTLQQYSGGRWVAFKSGNYRLSSAGKYSYTLTGTHRTGVKYRVSAAYLTGISGDRANATTNGPWKYFIFTS